MREREGTGAGNWVMGLFGERDLVVMAGEESRTGKL